MILNKKVNVILTSAGRRNYLINYFQASLAGQGSVFAADASSMASALQEADGSFIVPHSSDPLFIDTLISICKNHGVRLLFPLNDLELSVLAQNRERFREVGTIPVVSSPEVVEICFDKWETVKFLQKIGLKAPKTYLSLGEARQELNSKGLSFPLVVKPRWGSASIGIEYVKELEELEMVFNLSMLRHMNSAEEAVPPGDQEHCLLIQEKLAGQEFGLDVVNDLNGQYVTTFVKQKLSMRAGETDRALTVKNRELESIGEKIGKNLGHVGNLDCDIFVTGDDFYVLEMNPRFGGGYPFSHMAGADIPSALIAWAENQKPDPEWLTLKPGLALAKFDSVIEVKKLNYVSLPARPVHEGIP